MFTVSSMITTIFTWLSPRRGQALTRTRDGCCSGGMKGVSMMKNLKFFGMQLFVAAVFIALFCFGSAACGSGEGASPDEPVSEEVAVCGLSDGCDISDVSYIGEEWGKDHYVLNDAAIDGDTLTLNVSYSGGCEPHEFILVISESFVGTEPVELRVVLAHDANNDLCEAFLTEKYIFDLGVIKTRYQDIYRQNAGIVVLLLDDRRIHYEFGP